MTRVAREQLTPGLTLGKPVYNLNGVLLLRGGEVLTAKHLQIFKTWGVREVDVVGEEGSEAVAPDAPVPPSSPPRWRRRSPAASCTRIRSIPSSPICAAWPHGASPPGYWPKRRAELRRKRSTAAR